MRTVTVRDRSDFGAKFPYPKADADLQVYCKNILKWVIQDFSIRHAGGRQDVLYMPWFYAFPYLDTNTASGSLVRQLEASPSLFAEGVARLLAYKEARKQEALNKNEGTLALNLPSTWGGISAYPETAEFMYHAARTFLVSTKEHQVVVAGWMCSSPSSNGSSSLVEYHTIAVAFPQKAEPPQFAAGTDFTCIERFFPERDFTDHQSSTLLKAHHMVAVTVATPNGINKSIKDAGSHPTNMIVLGHGDDLTGPDNTWDEKLTLLCWEGEGHPVLEDRPEQFLKAITPEVESKFNPGDPYARFKQKGILCQALA